MGNKFAGLQKKREADRFAVRIHDRHILPLRDRGLTYRAIATCLNETQVATANRGGRWHASRIAQIVARVSSMDLEHLARVRDELDRDDLPPPGGGSNSDSEILLPRDLVKRAIDGDTEAATSLRKILGVTATFWAEMKTAVEAIDRREFFPVDRLKFLGESKWEQMLAQSVEAQALRMSGKPSEALSIIERWLDCAESNPYARADLFRRRCFILLQMGRFNLALLSAQCAASLYEDLCFSGYDLDECGLENALLAMGQAYGFSGNHQEAVSTFRRALSSVDVARTPDLHGYLVGALAIDLAALDSHKAQIEARSSLADVRSRFFRRGPNRSTYHMARLDWLEGSLMWQTATHNRHRARDMVRRGRDLLTELEVPLDAACCAVDVEMMWRPEHRCEAMKDLFNWHDKAQSILPAEVDEGIQEVRNALVKPNIQEPFRVIVWRVRNALGKLGSVMPSFVCEKKDLAPENLFKLML